MSDERITPTVDVVQRLRIHAEAIEDCTPVPYQKMAEVQALAADEIERLRQRVLELMRPPRGIGGQIVTVADGCPTYGDLLDAYYRTENEYADHFAKLWQRIKEQDTRLDRYDTFFDDAFTNDPFMKGALDAEWEAHNGSDGGDR